MKLSVFILKVATLRPSSNFFMNVMQYPGLNIPYGTVPEAPRSDGKFFFVFT